MNVPLCNFLLIETRALLFDYTIGGGLGSGNLFPKFTAEGKQRKSPLDYG